MKILEITQTLNLIHVKVDVTDRVTTLKIDSIKDIPDFKNKLKASVAFALRADEREEINNTLFFNINKMVGEELG